MVQLQGPTGWRFLMSEVPLYDPRTVCVLMREFPMKRAHQLTVSSSLASELPLRAAATCQAISAKILV
jgi:hypothetical protein